MPLSEQEQRLLDEMERNLYQSDADFVASGGRGRRPSARGIVLGVLLAVVGLAVLVTGVVVRQPLVGVLGFAVMFAGVLLGIAPPRRFARPVAVPPGSRSRAASSFMDRMNARWDSRRDGDDS
jgi:hypothetical protein